MAHRDTAVMANRSVAFCRFAEYAMNSELFKPRFRLPQAARSVKVPGRAPVEAYAFRTPLELT